MALPARPSEPAPYGRGWVERFKSFRDGRGLKPLLSLMIYLVIPLMGFQLILVQYPDLDPARFRNATILIVPLALLIVGAALVQEKHPKGELARLRLDGIYVVLTMLWMLSLIGGSTVIRSSYEGHPFTVDITPLVILTIITAAVNFSHDVFEYRAYRTGVERPAHASSEEQSLPAVAPSCAPPPPVAMGGLAAPRPMTVSMGPVPAPAVISFQDGGYSYDIGLTGAQWNDDKGSAVSYSFHLGDREPYPAPCTVLDIRTNRPRPDAR